jgi:dTDP-4-amino-4,6-dideoxygalactose transaminase
MGPVHGPYHQQLKSALCDYLGVNDLSPFTNGTIALVTTLQTLRITREVITTTVFLRRHCALVALEQYPSGIRRY